MWRRELFKNVTFCSFHLDQFVNPSTIGPGDFASVWVQKEGWWGFRGGILNFFFITTTFLDNVEILSILTHYFSKNKSLKIYQNIWLYYVIFKAFQELYQINYKIFWKFPQNFANIPTNNFKISMTIFKTFYKFY